MPNSINPFIQSLDRLKTTLHVNDNVPTTPTPKYVTPEEIEAGRAKTIAKYKADPRYNKLPAMEFSMSVNNRVNKVVNNLESLRAPAPVIPEPSIPAFTQKSISELIESSGFNRADRTLPKDLGQTANPDDFAKGSIGYGEAAFLKKQRELNALQPNFEKVKDLVSKALQSNDPSLLKKARTILEQDNLVVASVKGAKDMFNYYNQKITELDKLQRDFDLKETGTTYDDLLKGANLIVNASRVPNTYKLRGNTTEFQQVVGNVLGFLDKVENLGDIHQNRSEWSSDFYNDDYFKEYKNSNKTTATQRYKSLRSGLGYIQNAYEDKLKNIQSQIEKLNSEIGISNKSLRKESEDLNAMANTDTQAFRSEGASLKGSKDNDKITRFNAKVEAYNKNLKLTQDKLKGKSEELDAKIKQRDLLVEDFTKTQKEFKKVPEAIFSTDPALREQYDTEVRLNTPDNYENMSFEEQARNRVGNVVKNVLVDKIAYIGEKTGIFDKADALDYKTKHAPEHYLKAHDDLGRPIYSDKMTYTDEFGTSHVSPGAILETGTTVFADMAITALVTRGLASGIAGASQIGKATTLRNLMTGGVSSQAQRALTSKILNNAISSRALTYGAVTATTYPKMYFDNIGKFKTLDEAHNATLLQSGIEAATEAWLPQVNFFRGQGLFPNLGDVANMSKKQATQFITNMMEKGFKAGFRGLSPTLSKTAKITLMNFIQEGIVEEQAAFIANTALDQHFHKENAEYEVQNFLDTEHILESLVDSSLGMLISSIAGIPGNYAQAKHTHRYDFSDPKSLVNYQWNIATMPNTIKAEIKDNPTLTPEQKLKAYQLIDKYEATFKNSLLKTQKPHQLSLGQDRLATFTHFGASLLKEKAEEKLLEQQVLEQSIPDPKVQEDVEKYNKVISSIEIENEKWSKLSTEQKEAKWFQWFKEAHETPSFGQYALRLDDSQQNYRSIQDELTPSMQRQYDKVFKELDEQLPTKAQEQLKEIEAIPENQIAAVYEAALAQLPFIKPYIGEEKFLDLRQKLSQQFDAAVQTAPEETTTPVEETTTREDIPDNLEFEDDIPANKYNTLFEQDDAKQQLADIAANSQDPQSEIAQLEEYLTSNPDVSVARKQLINSTLTKLKERLAPTEDTTEPVPDSIEAKKADIERRKFEEIANYEASLGIVKSTGVEPLSLEEQIERDRIVAKYAAELAALEQPTEEEESPSSEEVFLNEDDLRGEYSPDFRPISGLITISDEYGFGAKTEADRTSDSISDPINTFLLRSQEAIAEYRGKLISNQKMFTDLGVNLDEVRTLLSDYWAVGKHTEVEVAVAKFDLKVLLKRVLTDSQVDWLLSERLDDVSRSVYGISDPKLKLDQVVLRTFSLLVTDQQGNPIKVNNKGLVSNDASGIPVLRALPKVKQLADKSFDFYSIVPFDLPNIQEDLEQLYTFQNEFLNNKNKEVPVEGLTISNGFDKTDWKQTPVEGLPIIIEQDNPQAGLSAGHAYTEEGDQIFSKVLSVVDRRAIATLLSKGLNKETNLYVNQLVHLKDEDKDKLRGKPVAEVEEFIKDKHYNIHKKSLDENARINPLNGDLEPGPAKLYSDFIKDKIYTWQPTPVIEGGNKKIYFSVSEQTPAQETPDNPAPEDLEWDYSKTNTPKSVTAREELTSFIWFMKSFLSKGIDLNMSFIDNPRAFATFTNAAITLWKGSNYTDLYHESWHRFTQNFLTRDQQFELYNSIDFMNRMDSPVKVKEEALAEAFRDYMLSGQKTISITVEDKTVNINVDKPKEDQKPIVNIFQRFYNFLKSLFTRTVNKVEVPITAQDLIREYFREASKTNTVRKADPANALFKSLDTVKKQEFPTTDVDGQPVSVFLDYASLYELNQGIDALFVQYFNQFYPTQTFTTLAQQKKETRDKAATRIYDSIRKDIQSLHDKEQDQDKKLEYKAVLDNFYYFIQNANTIRAEFTNVYKEFVDNKTTQSENDEVMQLADTYASMGQLELATENIINLVKLIPKTDKDSNPVMSLTWKLPSLSNFAENWLVLANNLSQLEYPQMLNQIETLSKTTHPHFKFLLDALPPDDLPVGSPASVFNLKIQFEQVFNMPRVDEMITIFGVEDGQWLTKFVEAGTSATREVLNQWTNDIDEFAQGQLFLDFPDKQSAISNPFEFLERLGITFTEIPQVNKALKTFKKKKGFDDSIGFIYDLIQAAQTKGSLIENPLEFIAKPLKGLNLKGESRSLNFLANLEVETNQSIADDMILRADGETAWKYNQYNYITKLIKAIDSPYEDLIALYPQFDIIKNPGIRNSNWFSTLFFVDENNKVSRSKSSALEYLKTGGLKSDLIGDEGEISINLTRYDKLAMDFYSFLNSGTEESVRFGDKSVTAAIRLIGGKDIQVGDTESLKELLYMQVIGELANIKHFDTIKFNKDSKQKNFFDKAKVKFVFFKKILKNEEDDKNPYDLLYRIEKEPISLDINNQWVINNPELKKEIMEAFDKFFQIRVFDGLTKGKEVVEPFKKALLDAFPANVDESKIVPKELSNKSLDDLALWYYMYSTLNRMDQFTILYGDPRNYKNGSDVFKRLSAYSAHGKFPATSISNLRLMNAEERYGRNIENLYTDNRRNWTSSFNMVQFKDIPVNLDPNQYLSKDMSPELREAFQAYFKEGERNKGAQSDASGAVTLDFYKALNILIGQWNKPQIDAYQDQVDFVRAKKQYEKDGIPEPYEQALAQAKSSYSDLLTVFNPKKWQYAGSIYSTHTPASKIDMRAFLKFSIMPLIPSNIEGTEMEQVAANMYTNATDLYVFESGSKMSIDQPNQEFEQWSSSTLNYNPTKLDLRNFKEQLPIENEFKEEGIFASQMRKLLSVGLFEKGKPVQDVTDYNRYKKAVDNITQLVKEELKAKMSDPKKLLEYLKNEFDKRELPEHVKDFLNYYDGKIVDTLDTSFQSFFMQNVLFSIVNNKLIKQKYSGGQFIQLPNTGYRAPNFKEVNEFKDDDLSFYVADGVNPTRSMEIKIAFSPKYESLLNLIHPDGNRIATLDRLNTAIIDSKFIEEHGKKFTMVGCRIPVQGFSTIESMRVKKFLDPIAGQVVIVPKGLTIKSGSDFDIDKLNIYEPHLNRDGNLINNDISVDDDILEIFNEVQTNTDLILNEIETIKTKIEETSAEFQATDNYNELLSLIDDAKSEESVELISGTITSFEDLMTTSKEPSKKLDTLLKQLDKTNEKTDEFLTYIDELKGLLNDRKVSLRNNKRFQKNLMDSEINALIQSISNIVLAPHNATNLITQNEPDYVHSGYEGNGIPGKDDATLDISDITDPIISNKVFEDNTTAKSSLGIAAKNNPLFAMFLEAGMRVINPSPTRLNRNNNDDGTVSMSSLHTQPFSNSSDKYNLKDKDGNKTVPNPNAGPMYIPKVLSDFVSVTVDVANDSRVGKIRFNNLLAPMYIYGVIQGTHLFDVMDLLLDPAVANFIQEYQKKDSIVYQHYVKANIPPAKQQDYLSKTRLKEVYIMRAAPPELRVTDKKGNFSYLDTAWAIIDHSVRPWETPNGVLAPSSKEAITIAEFIIMLEDSNKLSNLSAAISWDTNTSKSFAEFAYSNYEIDKLKDDGFFDPEAIDRLKKDSVITPLDVNDFVQSQFSPLFSIVSSNQFMGGLLGLYESTYGVSLENFARDYTNDFFTFLYQNNAKNEDGKLLYQDLILDQKLLDKKNANNIENQFKSIRDKIPTLRDINSFAKSLIFKKTRSSNVINPRLRNANADVHTLNLLHQDMQKMMESSYMNGSPLDAQLQEVTKKLILSTSLLNGVNKTFGSFTEIIPTKIYTSTLRDIKDPYKDIATFYKMFIDNRASKYFRQTKASKKDKQNRFNYFMKPQENVVSSQDMTVRAEIPQNKISGVESYGSTVEATDFVKERLKTGTPFSIDMIEAGLRTRTTRSATEMEKYNVKVGDLIKHFGTSENGKTKEVFARVTAIYPKGTPEWTSTWNLEGWSDEDITALDRFKPGAAAIVFQVITVPTAPGIEGSEVVSGIAESPPSGFQGYVGGFESAGKGTIEGDGKDKAMRKVADAFVGELTNPRNNSSTRTSAIEIMKKHNRETGENFDVEYDDGISEPVTTVNAGSQLSKVVMLARNGKLAGTQLDNYTKRLISGYNEPGVSFVVGDMPYVDSPFIHYLQEIGATFSVYHTGSKPRITVEDVGTSELPPCLE